MKYLSFSFRYVSTIFWSNEFARSLAVFPNPFRTFSQSNLYPKAVKIDEYHLGWAKDIKNNHIFYSQINKSYLMNVKYSKDDISCVCSTNLLYD